MPKRLDMFVAKSVLACFALGVLAFFGMYVFIDLFNKIGKLPSSPDLPMPLHLARFYLLQFPDLFQRASALIFCFSCLFVLARMQRHRQTVAVLAGGVSMHRLQAGMLVLAVLLGQANLLFQEHLGSRANRILFLAYDKKNSLNKRSSNNIQFRDKVTFHSLCGNIIFKEDAGVDLLELDDVGFKDGRINNLHISLFDDRSRPRAKIYANEAIWVDKTITIKQGIVFPYFKNEFPMVNRHWQFDEAEVNVHVPLQTAFFSGIGAEMLSNSELSYFLHNPVMYSELIHRWTGSFNILFTLIVCLAVCTVILNHRPILAFFCCLLCCLVVYYIISLTKTSMASESMTLDVCLATYIATPISFFLMGRWLTPT